MAALFAMIFAAVAPAIGQNYEILSSTKNPDEIVSALKERLQLSKDQEERIRSIILEDFEKRDVLKKKYAEDDSTDELSLLIEQRRLTKETEGRIEEILTEEQMAAYEIFKEEYLAKAQREARARITDEAILIMKERLQLTEEQADIVLPIIDQAMKERQAIMQKFRGGGGGRGDMSATRGMREEMERIDERTEERLSKILTEEQMKEYKKIKEEQRDKMRERMRSQNDGRRGSKGGGGRGGGRRY